MIDWKCFKQLLAVETKREIEALFAENRKRGDTLVAVGFVFEFGRGQLEFDLCANTKRNAEQSVANYLSKYPNGSAMEIRWNSGDFDYPVANSEFSDALWDQLKNLDNLAKHERNRQVVYDNVVATCCHVMAECAQNGAIPDWNNIDLNVAELLDDMATIVERDKYIRSLVVDAG